MFRIFIAMIAVAAGCAADPGACGSVTGTCVEFKAGTPELQIQAKIVDAKANTTFLFGAGTFKFTNAVVFAVDGITVRGAGIDKTTLDFEPQVGGAEGMLAMASRFTIEDMTVQNTRGNGVKAVGAEGVTFRRLRVKWTRQPNSTHGPYGIYPVQSSKVLIEDCIVDGAADAGIYVGQSAQIVVRNNEALNNVAGIEIENSDGADVYNNHAHDNTAGILIFALPQLQVKTCKNVRLHDNMIVNNNTDNFADPGGSVAIIPRGTGTFVLASSKVEVFNNTYAGNKSGNFSIISWPITQDNPNDRDYYQYSTEIFVHDNTFMGGGDDPDPTKDMGMLLRTYLPSSTGMRIGDVMWDGIPDAARTVTRPGNPSDLCMKNNGTATFLNLNFGSSASTDAAPFTCELPAVVAPTFAPAE